MPPPWQVIGEMRAGLADWEAMKRWDTLGISAQVGEGLGVRDAVGRGRRETVCWVGRQHPAAGLGSWVVALCIQSIRVCLAAVSPAGGGWLIQLVLCLRRLCAASCSHSLGPRRSCHAPQHPSLYHALLEGACSLQQACSQPCLT